MLTVYAKFTPSIFYGVHDSDTRKSLVPEDHMFETWGRVVYRRRRLILAIAGIGLIFAAVWGTGVFAKLQTAGGFVPASSQSQQEANLAAHTFGRGSGDVVVLYSGKTAITASPGFRSAVTRTLADLPHSQVQSYAT